MKLLTAFLLGALSCAGAASADTINVPADQATIQAAIDAANDGDTVLVAPGTYFEQLDFKGKAITVKSSGGAAVTTLDGNFAGPVVSFQHAEGNSSVLQGFTITHGSYSFGAGVYLSGASPTIIDDVFVANNQGAGGFGAGIGGNGSSPVIMWNYFTGNTCDGQFLSGVVAFVNSSSPKVVDNVFIDNNCRAIDMTLPTNTAVYVSNNTIVGNPAGIYVDSRVPHPNHVYRNNILYQNTLGLVIAFGSAANYPSWKHNLVFGSATADYQGIPDQTGTNSDISADPSFADLADGSVRLNYGSPAIDIADTGLPALPATDYYGKSQPFAGIPGGQAAPDLGAAEYHPPVVTGTAGALQAYPNTPGTGTLGESGADSTEPLTFAIVTQPAHGAVTVTDPATGAVQYVPAQDYIGPDSFSFHVTDPYGTVSDPVTEQVTVADVAPVANDGSVQTAPDVAAAGSLSATPVYPAQTLTFSVVSPPAHGTVKLTYANQFKYTPDAGFVGSDSFTFQVTDQWSKVSNTATEQVTVAEVAPVADAGSVKTTPDTAVTSMLPVTRGYASQKLAFTVVSSPLHGTLSINSATGLFVYTPTAGFAGSDSFSFSVTDVVGTVSNVAAESITVNDLAPKATAASITVRRGQTFRGTLGAIKAYSGQVLTYAVGGNPTYGQLTITDASTGAFTFTVPAGSRGQNSFSFKVTDQWGTASNIAVVRVVVL